MRNLSYLFFCICMMFFAFGCGGDNDSDGGSRQPTNTIRLTSDLPPADCFDQYEVHIDATGGSGSYTYELVDGEGELPDGITMSEDGWIFGIVPCDVGTHGVRIKLTDTANEEMFGTFDITFLINYIAEDIDLYLPFAQVGKEYNARITADSGDEDYTFSILKGAFPEGLKMIDNGEISGTIKKNAVPRDYVISIKNENTEDPEDVSLENVLLTVFKYMPDKTEPITDTGQPVPAGYEPLITPLRLDDDERTKKLTIHKGDDVDDIPMEIDSDTEILISVNASDGVGVMISVFDDDNIILGPDVLDPSDSTYIQNIKRGTYTIQISSPQKEPCEYQISINDLPKIELKKTGLMIALTGKIYFQEIEASGGSGNYIFSLEKGNLPEGLNFVSKDTKVVITGKVDENAALDEYVFYVRVEDSEYSDNSLIEPMSIHVFKYTPDETELFTEDGFPTNDEPEIEPLTLDKPTKKLTLHSGDDVDEIPMIQKEDLAGVELSVNASNGVDLEIIVFDSKGKKFKSTPLDRSKPTVFIPYVNGTCTIKISSPKKEPCEYDISVIGVPELKITTPAELPIVLTDKDLAIKIEASGGYGDYRFSADENLPEGLTIDPAGNLSGKVQTADTYTFNIEVTSGNISKSKAFSIEVEQGLKIIKTALPDATNNYKYTPVKLESVGGSGNYIYNTLENLPTGLTLDPTKGTVSGTPNATAGEYKIMIEVIDGDNRKTGYITITVKDDIQFSMSAPEYYWKTSSYIKKDPSGNMVGLSPSITKKLVWKGKTLAEWNDDRFGLTTIWWGEAKNDKNAIELDDGYTYYRLYKKGESIEKTTYDTIDKNVTKVITETWSKVQRVKR